MYALLNAASQQASQAHRQEGRQASSRQGQLQIQISKVGHDQAKPLLCATVLDV
jgi:hypothetical protein